MLRFFFICALLLVLCSSAFGSDKAADWIGVQPEDAATSGSVVFSKTFNLDFDPLEAYIKFTSYTSLDFGATTYKAFINGVAGGSGSYWPDVKYINISQVLKKGGNRVDIEVSWVQTGTPGPVLVKIIAIGKDEEGEELSEVIRSDETWSYSVGNFNFEDIGNTDIISKKPIVIGNAYNWQPAKSPQVLPKINTITLSGVTDVKLNGGNAGSFYQYNYIRDFSDKFYFLKALGYYSIEDYIFSQTNYRENGEWFWGYDKQIAYNHNKEGFAFSPNPWAWIPAEWYSKENDLKMARCLEHNQDGFALSLWDPQLLKLNKDMYAGLKTGFTDSISAIYPGIYGDFGETNFIAGLNPWLNPKPKHQHAGFWAGDDLAIADFKNKMLKKYETIEAINAAWKTDYTSIEDINLPILDGTDSRRYALDFINWYYDSMTDYTVKVCSIAKDYFPEIPITAKLGSVDENPMWGQDNSAIPRELAKIGIGVCATHGPVSNLTFTRIASACKFYGNRFETETTTGTNRKDAAKKIFTDASNGVSSIFEYPKTMLEIADIFSEYRKNIRGEHSITEAALFFPTSWHRYNIRQGNPPKLAEAANEIRDILDYDVVDENMALDGALDKYRVIAMFDGDFMELAVYLKLYDWVNRGGTLLLRAEQLPITNIEGVVISDPQLIERAKQGDTTINSGKGRIIIWAGNWENRQEYYHLIHNALYPAVNESIDGKQDNVWISLFKNRALYLNINDTSITIQEKISENTARRIGLDFEPQYLTYEIEIPANGQAVHFFNKPFAEITIECEEMRGAEKHTVDVIYRGGYGITGRAIRVQDSNYLMESFSIDKDGEYGFYCIIDPVDGSPAQLEIDGKPVATIYGPAGYHKYMYPLNAKLHLKRGNHILTLRFGNGRSLADKVIITTDTDLTGFTYGFIDPQADQTW